MSDPNTVRVLEIDGGGTRGRVTQQFLKRFINQWGINPNELWKHFDVIAGTSSGGMQALTYAYGLSPEDLDDFILNKSKRVFTTRPLPVGCDSAVDSLRPDIIQKIVLILANEPFYKSICAPNAGDSNWGSNILQSSLEEIFGADTLQALKTQVIVPSYQQDNDTFVLFSNNQGSPYIGATEKIVDVARCTSAAPAYLPAYELNGHTYLDGGIYANNASDFALTLARASKPTANRAVVVSLGTGLGSYGFDGTPTTGIESTIELMFSLFNIASTGGQEAVNVNMQYAANSTLQQLEYYRFNIQYPPTFDAELDNSTAAYFDTLDAMVTTKYNEDIDAISDIIARLEA